MILVLNIGLKNARCIVFTYEGKVLADRSKPVKTYISNERVEQSPSEWWDLSKTVIRKAILDLGEDSKKIEYLTITTSASCLVVLDKNKKILRNSILVSDTRAVKEALELDNHSLFKKVKEKSGIKSSPDLMIPKIMWLSKNEPNIFNNTAYYLNISDYLTLIITGKFITDPNNASKFHYDVFKNSYPDELLNSLKIPVDRLPKVVPQGTVLGTVLPKVAEILGIPKSCKLVLSTYDALAAVAGNGAFEVGDAVDVSGTVTSIRLVTDHKLDDPAERIYVTSHFRDNHWLCGGSNNLGGGIIEWAKQLFLKNEANPYDKMESMANRTSICPGGLIFLPYLLGERTPFWNPCCRGIFFGLNRSHGKQHMIKAIFEGVGFSIWTIFKVFEELKAPIHSVSVAGGLSRIDTINQIKSDMLNVEVLKYDNFETTAIGAALIALVGIGEYDNIKDAFNTFCSLEKVYKPNRSNHMIYEDFFQLYMNVYENLKTSFTLRTTLLNKLKQKNIDELVLADNL